MSITLKQFDGGLVTPTDDAKLYHYILQSSGIMSGCVASLISGNQLRVTSGRGMIMGRMFVVEEETILANLPTIGITNGRLLIRIDTTNSDAPISFVTQEAETLPALVQEDINESGTIYEIPLATYTAGQVDVTNFAYGTQHVFAPYRPNLLINGSLQVAQRYNAADSTTYTNPSNKMILDMFLFSGTGTVIPVSGGGMDITGSIGVTYIMSDLNFASIDGKTVTLSYSVDGAITVETYDNPEKIMIDKQFTDCRVDWFNLVEGEYACYMQKPNYDEVFRECYKYYRTFDIQTVNNIYSSSGGGRSVLGIYPMYKAPTVTYDTWEIHLCSDGSLTRTSSPADILSPYTDRISIFTADSGYGAYSRFTSMKLDASIYE